MDGGSWHISNSCDVTCACAAIQPMMRTPWDPAYGSRNGDEITLRKGPVGRFMLTHSQSIELPTLARTVSVESHEHYIYIYIYVREHIIYIRRSQADKDAVGRSQDPCLSRRKKKVRGRFVCAKFSNSSLHSTAWALDHGIQNVLCRGDMRGTSRGNHHAYGEMAWSIPTRSCATSY